MPFYAAERVDLAVQWDALLEGELVGRIVMERPELNFVDAADESEDQTGAGEPWLEIIRDLFPFRINSTLIRDGSVHFRAFDADPPVDVYLSEVEASIQNLTNLLTVVGNVLRNAFVRAYLPRFEGTAEDIDVLEFGPASIIDPILAGDNPGSQP